MRTRYSIVVSQPERRELLARGPVAPLRLVAEREQRLLAARLGARARDRRAPRPAVRYARSPRFGGRRERAVVADVAAELRQRDEDLRRVRDEAALALGPEGLRGREQIGRIGLDERESFVPGKHAVRIRRGARLPPWPPTRTCSSRSSASTTRRADSRACSRSASASALMLELLQRRAGGREGGRRRADHGRLVRGAVAERRGASSTTAGWRGTRRSPRRCARS